MTKTMRSMGSGLVVAIALAGCASATKMTAAPQVPAAEGTVKAGSAANDNTSVDVKVKYLAPPQKVASDATTYVVWAKPHDPSGNATPQNLGALEPNANREGELKTVTSLKSFDVVVTPETTASAAAPTHDPVLTASIQR